MAKTHNLPEIQAAGDFDKKIASKIYKLHTFKRVHALRGAPKKHANEGNAFLGFATVDVAVKSLPECGGRMPGLAIKLRGGKLRVEWPTRSFDRQVDGEDDATETFVPVGYRPGSAEMRMALTAGVLEAYASDIAKAIEALNDSSEDEESEGNPFGEDTDTDSDDESPF